MCSRTADCGGRRYGGTIKMSPSAPSDWQNLANVTESAVVANVAPKNTGIRPLVNFRTSRTIPCRSSGLSSVTSPAEPMMKSADVPYWICRSIRILKPPKSMLPSAL